MTGTYTNYIYIAHYYKYYLTNILYFSIDVDITHQGYLIQVRSNIGTALNFVRLLFASSLVISGQYLSKF